jgi:hypothetical protein
MRRAESGCFRLILCGNRSIVTAAWLSTEIYHIVKSHYNIKVKADDRLNIGIYRQSPYDTIVNRQLAHLHKQCLYYIKLAVADEIEEFFLRFRKARFRGQVELTVC